MTGFKLQQLIHSIEEGGGARLLKWFVIWVAFVGLAVLYDGLNFQNLASDEAMDAAQVARKVAEGRGFSTDYVRPLSIHLISAHRKDRSAQLKQDHPDLANAPLYPLLLAPLMKFIPPQDLLALKTFSVARHDLAIAILNQCLMLITVVLVYRFTRARFDRPVAIVATAVFATTELYWHFSISGLSTNLLLLLIMLLVGVLAAMDDANRVQSAPGKTLFLAVCSGLLVGAMMLTRYACGFLLFPVAMFIGAFIAGRRAVSLALMVLAFAATAAPWIARNIHVSGLPFGTASYAMMEHTRLFPENTLQRMLHPDTSLMPTAEYTRKLIVNLRDVVISDLPAMGGSWVWALFLAGLLIPFRNVTLIRLRWFLVAGLITFALVQALGKTEIWTQMPEVNSENLLVLLSPIVLVFGVGAFFVLVDSFQFPTQRWRYAAWAAFALLMALPLILMLAPPHRSSIADLREYPPHIQEVARWLDSGNTMMTDVPAAAAWYGHRQAILTTLSWREDFAEIHDYHKPVNALFLTSRTTDSKSLGNWMRGDTNGWDNFAIELKIRREVPSGFPLLRGIDWLGRGEVLLMDFERWRRPER